MPESKTSTTLTRKNFGHRLAGARRRAKLTQVELAHSLRMSSTQLGHYESGRRFPSLTVLTQMALLLQVSLDSLVGLKRLNLNRKKLDLPEETRDRAAPGTHNLPKSRRIAGLNPLNPLLRLPGGVED